MWKRAWEMDVCYWAVEARCHRSLDLLSELSRGPKYSIWWHLSDGNHMLLRDCEIMIKLITHASLLKDDDVRLKGLPISSRFCVQCDHAAMDDARHLIMQCPELQDQRSAMFRELSELNGGMGDEILQAAPDTLVLLLGREVENEPISDQMVEFWSIAARHIADMYRLKLRIGIG